MQINTFKIELEIYLNTCKLSLKALNTLNNAGIIITYIQRKITTQQDKIIKIL
ncbi:hypothetical protein RIR_e55348_A0A2N0NEU2_9GLOM [Rhizophagus irregularis DAOM 181602=DAOM 197198]|nr:hypothetical protein RIR_e55348_A0A2N0NEU2_9GLOM [Rhizophagus irregularis DAOM 181602=DAOM 197198]